MDKYTIEEILDRISEYGMSARDLFFQKLVTRFFDDIIYAMKTELSDIQKDEAIRKIDGSKKR
jgi:hypothetical protein